MVLDRSGVERPRRPEGRRVQGDNVQDQRRLQRLHGPPGEVQPRQGGTRRGQAPQPQDQMQLRRGRGVGLEDRPPGGGDLEKAWHPRHRNRGRRREGAGRRLRRRAPGRPADDCGGPPCPGRPHRRSTQVRPLPAGPLEDGLRVSAAGKSYEQTIRRTAESPALYDDSGAAGRRLLRELEDALDDAQGRDGAEGAKHATATNGYREETGPSSAREPFVDRSEEIEGSYRVESYEEETPEQREPSAGDPESDAPQEAPGRGGGESGGAPSGTSVPPATRSYGHNSPPSSPTSPSYTASCLRG